MYTADRQTYPWEYMTPGWEPLPYSISVEGQKFLWRWNHLKFYQS